MSLKSRILAFLSSEEPKAIELAEEKLENGTVLISDDFKEGMPIFIKSQDEGGENVKLPIGEYQMEDGKILNVEVEGEITSIQEAKIEAEEPSEEQEELEVIEEEAETKEDEVQEDEDHMEVMHKMIASLEARILAMEELYCPENKEEANEEELVSEEKIEMSAEEVVAEEPVMEPAIEVVAEETQAEVEVAPIAHSPEASDERRVRFYFPKN